ncbi:putative Hemerythrin-like, metal-binding protein [Magnetospirillum sp. LM-5]|nr:putative Hemerythrin-like, metal-binding protein [Magnetospirillum sp. LM-5]
MHRLPWMDGLNVGVAALDEAHRDMFYLMGDLSEAVHAKSVRAALAMARDFVTKVEGHFKVEGEMMTRLGFPGAAVHQAKHATTRDKVIDLERALSDENLGLASTILGELESVYFRELLNEDMILANYISAQAS